MKIIFLIIYLKKFSLIFILNYSFHFKPMFKAWAYSFQETYQCLKMYYIYTFIVCKEFFSSNNLIIFGRKLPLDQCFHWKRYTFDFQLFK